MIVVDTNIIAYLLLGPSDFSERAEALLRQDADWMAPSLWRSELRNILSGYIRRGQLTLQQAQAIQQAAELHLVGAEREVNSSDVLTLVQQSDCSAYDCEFVALAQHWRISLYTMDKKILRAFPDTARSLADVQPY